MKWLTDCPQELALLVGNVPSIRSLSTDLPVAERDLWRALDGGPELVVAPASPGSPSGLWRLGVVVARAPRSQYDALHDALGRGLELPGPTACLALGGRGFHGQHNRAWSAAAGNLFLTVGLAPQLPVEPLVPALTMLPAVAVVDAIHAAGGAQACPGIKWVNDILIGGRKVGGVLTATHVRAGVVESAVLGIGVNVTEAPRVEPTPFVPAAGSLQDSGVAVDLGPFLLLVLECLALRYRELMERGGASLLETYRACSVIVGEAVRLWDRGSEHGADPSSWPAPAAAGVVQSIEADLSLRLTGCPEPIHRGRLALESACRALGV